MSHFDAHLSIARKTVIRYVSRLRMTALAQQGSPLRKLRLPSLEWPSRRTLWATLLLCIGFYVAAQIGLTLHFPGSLVYFVWPPSVLVFVALALSPRRYWWVYFLAFLPVHMFTEWNTVAAPSAVLALFYLPVWAQALAGAFCLERLGGRPLRLDTVRRLIIFLFSCVVVASVTEAATLALILVLTTPNTDFWITFGQTVLADALAMVVLAPALVSGWVWVRQLGLISDNAASKRNWLADARAAMNSWRRTLSVSRVIEASLLALGLFFIALLAFGDFIELPGTLPALLYTLLPLLLWSAMRFGLGSTSLALCGLTLTSVWFSIHGHGLFARFSTNTNLFSLQLFFIAISIPVLILAVLMRERSETDATLHESEVRFRTMADQAPVLVWMAGPDALCTYFNTVWLDFTGRTLEQERGTGWMAGIHPDDRAQCAETYLSAFEARRPFEMEYRLRRFDGAYRWLVCTGVPRYAPNDRFEGYIGSDLDITDRKQAAEALEQSEARYRDLVESQTDMICRYLPDSTLTYVNEAYCRHYGKTCEQLVGTRFFELMDAEGRDYHARYIAALLEYAEVSIDEHQINLPGGGVAWQQWIDHTIRDANGVVVEIQSIGRDITDRKRAEEALRASEERYRAVVNNFPRGAVLLFDHTLRHVFADGQELPILVPSKEAIEGKSVWEAFPAALAAALAPKYRAALAGTQTAFDLTVGGRTYQTQVLPIEYGGATAGMAILQDVTEQRRVEVLAELDRAKTAFLSNVSHEFRTPLTLLLGPTSDALADRVSPLPPRQRERLEFIRRGGLRLHKLVNTLLDFSRIQAGHVQPTYTPTDIATRTADLASTFRSAVERAGLRLVVDCAPLGDLPQPVYLDRDMWEQIVLNLLSNALKFTFAGEITVIVRTTGRKGDGVKLEVRDTGSGIPDEELPHVFDRFYRVQNAHARTDEGTGIGLALVQELVRLHGGTVQVTSVLGKGSAFTVTIPTGNAHLPSDRVARREYPSDARIRPVRLSNAALFADDALGSVLDTPGEAPAPLPTTAAQNEHASDSQPSFEGASGQGVRETHAEAHATPTARATILVADDNADMRAYLVRLLSEHWDVRTATDGLSALDAANSHPPDLIVADVIMPGLDGFALIAALRDNPQTLATPVILLSARAGDEATVEGLQAGADDYLIKPFSSRELLARVQTHLELARVRKESAARAAQLDAIFEAIGDGVLVHDIERNKMRANHAQRDLQRRRLEVLGRHVDPSSLLAIPGEWERHSMIRDEHGRTIPLEEWPTERALRGETLTGANAVDEFTQGANGEILQVNVSAAPVRNASGQITGAVAVFRDVTERRQLERRVAEQASQLEAIFAAQADGVAVVDAQGHFLRANQALREIVGMDADSEFPMRSLPERMERMSLLDEQGQRIPEAQWPRSRVLKGEILAGANAMDARIKALDGRDVWISITGAPIRDSDRRVTGAVLVTRDVTARRELERQVAEQASQLQAVFEAMTDGVFVLDTKGRITRINPAAQTFLDRAPGDSSSQDFAEARAQLLDLRDAEGRPLPLEQLPTHRLLHGEVLAADSALTLTVRAYNGRERTISLTGGPLRDAAGRITGGVSVARDITELKRTQTALAGQERLFRTLVENSPDIISRFDRDLRFLYISPASESLTGVPPQARLGKTYAELGLPEAIFAPWEAALREVFATGQPQTFESGYGTGDQMTRVSRVSYIPEFAADGSVESVLGITTDITALKQSEDALRQSEERFSTAFHASPIGLSIVSLADYRILDVNAAEAKLTGYSRDEMVGSRVAELGLIAFADIDVLREVLGREARITEAPVTVRTKSGEMRSCLSSVERIRVGDEDCLIVTTRDVTEREHAEEALKRQERLFRTLVENSPDIIARFDRQLRYLYISPAIANVAPIPPERYLGKTNQELGLPEVTYALAHRAIEQVFQTGESITLLEDDADVHDVHEARYYRAQILPELAEDGAVESALTVTTEITDLKRAEVALREATAVAQAAQREEALRRREAERREQIAESLRDVLTILNSDRQVTKIFDFITRQAGRLLSSDAAAIYMTDSDTAPGTDTAAQTAAAAPASRASKGSLELQSAFGLSPALTSPRGKRRLSAGDAALLRAMVARKPVAVFASPPATSGRTRTNHQSAPPQHPVEPQISAVDDISDYVEVREEALPAPYRALLAIPIVTQGHAYGSLLLLYAAPHRFSSEEVALAMAYGDQIALAVANTHLQGHIERAAAEAERNRLARDLHDTVTQEIFTASVLAESIPKVWKHRRAEAEASLRQVHQLTRSALAALRALLLELRPMVLEQKTLEDLLRQLGEVMTMRSGAPIEVAVADDCPPLPIAVKVAFYRIAQEALMNAAKYANAHTIFVRLHYLPTEEAIQLDVQDDGRGFEARAVPAGHFGLGMMRERARAVGASLRITSRDGHGVRVAVKWAEKGGATPIAQEYAVAGRARRKPIHHGE